VCVCVYTLDGRGEFARDKKSTRRSIRTHTMDVYGVSVTNYEWKTNVFARLGYGQIESPTGFSPLFPPFSRSRTPNKRIFAPRCVRFTGGAKLFYYYRSPGRPRPPLRFYVAEFALPNRRRAPCTYNYRAKIFSALTEIFPRRRTVSSNNRRLNEPKILPDVHRHRK